MWIYEKKLSYLTYTFKSVYTYSKNSDAKEIESIELLFYDYFYLKIQLPVYFSTQNINCHIVNLELICSNFIL